MMKFFLRAVLTCVVFALLSLPGQADRDTPPSQLRPVSDELRNTLLHAREAAWRAFFSKDPALLDRLIGPELVAIQESQEQWESREHMKAVAKWLWDHDVTLRRLEFPRTEIQIYGNTAILYYTYVFETATAGKSTGTDAGRGTEIFVLRDGQWVDVGWHLDNGAFLFRDGKWNREGSYPSPEPSPAPSGN
jgi:hypothetical protein